MTKTTATPPENQSKKLPRFEDVYFDDSNQFFSLFDSVKCYWASLNQLKFTYTVFRTNDQTFVLRQLFSGVKGFYYLLNNKEVAHSVCFDKLFGALPEKKRLEAARLYPLENNSSASSLMNWDGDLMNKATQTMDSLCEQYLTIRRIRRETLPTSSFLFSFELLDHPAAGKYLCSIFPNRNENLLLTDEGSSFLVYETFFQPLEKQLNDRYPFIDFSVYCISKASQFNTFLQKKILTDYVNSKEYKLKTRFDPSAILPENLLREIK